MTTKQMERLQVAGAGLTFLLAMLIGLAMDYQDYLLNI